MGVGLQFLQALLDKSFSRIGQRLGSRDRLITWNKPTHSLLGFERGPQRVALSA